MFEKNIYVRQAEVKGSIKQQSNGTFIINEITVNSTLKNYEQTLHNALEITINEVTCRNQGSETKSDRVILKKEKKTPVPPKKEKTKDKTNDVKGLK